MIALTIRQPYASRVIAGTKRIENRSRHFTLRGQVLIHAGGALHDRFRRSDWDPDVERIVGTLPRKAILGAVQLVDIHNALTCKDPDACTRAGGERPTRQHPTVFHWVLDDVVRFETEIPRVNGALGFWHPDDRVQHLAQLELDRAAVRG